MTTNRANRGAGRGTLVAACLAAFLAACATGTPAGAGAAGEGRTEAATEVPAGALYRDRCGRCHVPFPPHAYEDRQWDRVLRKMAPQAGLDPRETGDVLRWLQQHN